MQGAATQAMWWHRRGAATPQMPAGLGASSKMYTLFPDGPLPGLACRTTLESLVLRPKPAYVDGEGSLTRSTCRAQSSENGRGLPHSRDGHATRLAWHERLNDRAVWKTHSVSPAGLTRKELARYPVENVITVPIKTYQVQAT